jgi:hypothetical protein
MAEADQKETIHPLMNSFLLLIKKENIFAKKDKPLVLQNWCGLTQLLKNLTFTQVTFLDANVFPMETH